MITNGLGYIFDARYDVFKHIGLLENYKMMDYKGMQNVFLTFSVDSVGKPIIPSYIDIGEGFLPLTKKVIDNDVQSAMQTYVKSNKPTISILESTSLIVDGKFSFDMETKEFLKDTTDIKLYVPKTVKEGVGIYNTKGEPEPGIVCDIVKTTDGLNTIVVDEKVYNGYIQNILKYVKGENTKDRVSFLVSRVQK